MAYFKFCFVVKRKTYLIILFIYVIDMIFIMCIAIQYMYLHVGIGLLLMINLIRKIYPISVHMWWALKLPLWALNVLFADESYF